MDDKLNVLSKRKDYGFKASSLCVVEWMIN
jgi:hypothetical protein